MRIMIMFNPISGVGSAVQGARAVARFLHLAGHETLLQSTQHDAPDESLDSDLKQIDVIIVAGGDGAVRHALGPARRTSTPIYHMPFGTENLFAREFGMNRDYMAILKAIQRFSVRKIDVGVVNGLPFALMTSIGFDADVVHELARRRSASISHISYVAPIITQIYRWRPQRLSVTVDDNCIVDNRLGFVVVANSRQYGWHIDPAPRAVIDDGLFDVVFFPAARRLDLINWAFRCRMRQHVNHRLLIYQTSRKVEITSERPFQYQLDGDPPVNLTDDSFVKQLEIEIQPRALPVLLP